MSSPPPRPFRAFASYSTDRDAKLVRRVESFLETLDRNPIVRKEIRRSVELCVDGSDFKLPSRSAPSALAELVASYLALSDYLIVFSGPHTVDHPWIRFELQWWLANREPESILLALTAGDDPRAPVETLFPPEAVAAGLHHTAWFDLRGGSEERRGERKRVRDFERELVRLAAFLIDPDLSANDLIRHYEAEAA